MRGPSIRGLTNRVPAGGLRPAALSGALEIDGLSFAFGSEAAALHQVLRVGTSHRQICDYYQQWRAKDYGLPNSPGSILDVPRPCKDSGF